MDAKTAYEVPELQDQYRDGKISRREFIRGAALLGVSLSGISAFLAGCSVPPAAPTVTTAPVGASTPTTAPSPTKTAMPALTPTPTGPNGELRVGLSTFGAENFDPVTSIRTPIICLQSPIFDFLVMMDPSEKVSTGVAERWEMAADGLSWTFYIRKGIKFHDGSDLTAKDVKFSLDRYAAKDATSAFIRDAQERVEVVDDYTVRVYTKGVQPYYWRFVGSVPGYQGMIIPKDNFEKVGREYFSFHPVGSGPFKFVRHVPGDMVEYEALDKHYRQVPAFKKLSTILIPEETTRVAMLKTGELDAIDVSVDSVPELGAVGLKMAALSASQGGVQFHGAYDPRAKGMPIADVRVREALSLAINRDEIGRTVFYGKMLPPMPPYMWPNQPEIDVPYWKGQAAKYYGYDPEKASQLLKDAGFPQGFTMKLYSMTTSGGAYLPRLALAIQGYWLKIGVKAEIVPIDWGVFRPMQRTGQPNKGPADQVVGQASMYAADGNITPTQAMNGRFWSQGSVDLVQGAIPELESLIPGSWVEPNAGKRFDMTAKAIQLAMDTRVMSVVGAVPTMAGLGPRVEIDFPTGAMAIPMYVENAKHPKL